MKRPSLRSRDGGVSEALAAGPAPGRKAAQDSRVCVGVITGAHGIRGDVKITSYTARPEDVAAYGRPEDEAGSRRFELSVKTVGKRGVRASILGISDRDSAVELAGTRLYVTRAALPEAGENEFYHGDLIGLRVERDDGSPLGRVAGVSDFGRRRHPGRSARCRRRGPAAVHPRGRAGGRHRSRPHRRAPTGRGSSNEVPEG